MRRENTDKGFTLVELLVVIVILGILATVAVFAVRGITDESNSAACSSDLKTVEQAEEANYADNGSYVSEADLVTNGYLKAQSNLHDISLSGGEYTITAAGNCADGGGSAPAASPVAGVDMTAITYQGLPAWQLTGADPQAIVLQGYGAQYDQLVDLLSSYGQTALAAGHTIVLVDTSSLPTLVPLATITSLLSGPGALVMVDPGTVMLEGGQVSVEMFASDFTDTTMGKCVVTSRSVANGTNRASMAECIAIFDGVI